MLAHLFKQRSQLFQIKDRNLVPYLMIFPILCNSSYHRRRSAVSSWSAGCLSISIGKGAVGIEPRERSNRRNYEP
ncbi:hypothetical protein PUN28_015699 [Cardiocondyla obscurior]|uniref:Uncharacterized protein n=1 Tax=Cardiocondyla obscurior TaxID=286306 RepID=A0AAW2EYP2_9HYME